MNCMADFRKGIPCSNHFQYSYMSKLSQQTHTEMLEMQARESKDLMVKAELKHSSSSNKHIPLPMFVYHDFMQLSQKATLG